MDADLDDTARPRPLPLAPEGDTLERRRIAQDDTVVRGSVPPTPLIEPPVPAPVALRVRVALPVPVALPAAAKPGPYRAQIPDGSEIDLDVPVYVGRRPSRPRIHVGREPRLVTLPSPLRELSSTHLELSLAGGALVATDMRSTNGTVIQLPGAAARRLIRGESAVVTPGTRIDLGDGAVLDILPPRPPAGSR